MKWATVALVITGLVPLGLLFPLVFSETISGPPSGTIDGDYALHFRTPCCPEASQASATGQEINAPIDPEKSYSFRFSAYIQSSARFYTVFSLHLEIDPESSIGVSFWVDEEGNIILGKHMTFHLFDETCGTYGTSLGPWSFGLWYTFEVRLAGGAAEMYLNGTLVCSSSLSPGKVMDRVVIGAFDTPLEVYVDSVLLTEDSRTLYSNSFENGLEGLAVQNSQTVIVDTVRFAGTGRSSSLLSLKLGDNQSSYYYCSGFRPPGHEQCFFGAPLASNLQITGRVFNASSLVGVADATVILESSIDQGVSHQLIGSSKTDENGDFSLNWTPMHTGRVLVRASFQRNCCFFGYTEVARLDVGRPTGVLSLALKPSATFLGFSVEIAGKLLTYDSKPISEATIQVSLFVPEAGGWTPHLRKDTCRRVILGEMDSSSKWNVHNQSPVGR